MRIFLRYFRNHQLVCTPVDKSKTTYTTNCSVNVRTPLFYISQPHVVLLTRQRNCSRDISLKKINIHIICWRLEIIFRLYLWHCQQSLSRHLIFGLCGLNKYCLLSLSFLANSILLTRSHICIMYIFHKVLF